MSEEPVFPSPPGEPTHHRVDCRGLGLHVVEWSGAGPTLVAHHGFLDNARYFDALAAHLVPRVRFLAVDARGQGDSEWVGAGGSYYFQDYVFDLADAVDALVPEGERVVLLGHSMGGMVGSYYAGAFPERVRAFVNVEGGGPPGQDWSDAPDQLRSWVTGVRKVHAAGRASRVVADLSEAAGRMRRWNGRLSEAQALHLAATGTREVEGGRAWKYDPLHRTRIPVPFYLGHAQAFWERVEAPTLFVYGSESPFRWDEAEGRDRMGDARIVTVEGAGHHPHVERPAALAAEIDRFLDGLPDPA